MLLAVTERFAVFAVHISDGYKRRLRDFEVAGVGSVEFSTQTKDSFETATLKLMLLDDHGSNVGLILRGSAAQRTMERAPLIRARAGTRAVRPASSIRTTENAVQRSRAEARRDLVAVSLARIVYYCTPLQLGGHAWSTRWLVNSVNVKQSSGMLHVRFDHRDGGRRLLLSRLKLHSIASVAQPLLVSICEYRAGGRWSEMQFDCV